MHRRQLTLASAIASVIVVRSVRRRRQNRAATRNMPLEIDHDDFREARGYPAHDLVREAAAEGARVEREGRQMW